MTTTLLDDEVVALRAHTRRELNLEGSGELDLDPIFKGGSDRSFYRCRADDGRTWILMAYTEERAENTLYVGIAQFLQEIGVRAPEIYAHNSDQRLVWMEDVGSDDLFALAEAPWKERSAGYRLALDEIRRLHQRGWNAIQDKNVPMMDGFGPKLYHWEQDYFAQHFLDAVCKMPQIVCPGNELDEELTALRERLQGAPVALVHRDFQSQNIILTGGRACLIDFQGLRMGTAFYDLGSLLYDPYTELPDDGRHELLDYYFAGTNGTYKNHSTSQLFYDASAQRLMQALGAYGFLGLKRGKPHFLHHIEPALRNLAAATRASGRLPALADLAQRCREELPLAPVAAA